MRQAVGNEDLPRLHVQFVVRREFGRQRLAQFEVARKVAVVHHTVIQRLLGGILDVLGRIEVGPPHFQVNEFGTLAHEGQGFFVHAEALRGALADSGCRPFHI